MSATATETTPWRSTPPGSLCEVGVDSTLQLRWPTEAQTAHIDAADACWVPTNGIGPCWSHAGIATNNVAATVLTANLSTADCNALRRVKDVTNIRALAPLLSRFTATQWEGAQVVQWADIPKDSLALIVRDESAEGTAHGDIVWRYGDPKDRARFVGHVSRLTAPGWGFNKTNRYRGQAVILDECLAVLSMPRDELEARYSMPQAAAARPWVIGVGVFVTHANPGDYPRVLYSQRRAGASHGVGAWAMPGGRLEATDADVIACARRETLEETGLTLADVRVLPGHKLGRRPDGTPYLTVFVHATVDASCIPTLEEDTNGWPVTRDMEPEKHHPWRWLTEGDLVEIEGEVWDRELALQVLEALDAPKLQPDQARERNVD